MKLSLSLLLIFVLLNQINAHDRPVIGIFTLPSDEKQFPNKEYSYIPASYVKQMESSGAMVIPISWEASYTELDHLISSVNGILFTGGDSDIYLNVSSPGYKYNKLTDSASFILMKALIQNKQGSYFPIMATCQGFQLLHYIASSYYEVLSPVADDLGVERLLTIVDQNAEMFINMDDKMKEYLQNVNGPYYSHHWGVLPETYEASQPLNSFFKITSLGQDGQGKSFVASAEARDYPIYTYQFHSEKHAFEWVSKADHDPVHILMGQHFANEFVSRARQNNNQFSEEELIERIIYNYVPQMLWIKSSFVQIYVFPRKVTKKKSFVQVGINAFIHN